MQYLNIWSGLMRLSHWGMALGVGFLLASGFFNSVEGLDQSFWYDWHVIVGQLLSIVLVLRIGLLFRPGTGNWQRFRLNRVRFQAMIEMLRFYVSLGQFPLPKWYAHNPIWLPIYVIMMLASIALVISGFALLYPESINEATSAQWHIVTAGVIGWVSLAHIIAVVMHDWKSNAAFISAMISGSRYFEATETKKGDGAFSIPVVKGGKDTK